MGDCPCFRGQQQPPAQLCASQRLPGSGGKGDGEPQRQWAQRRLREGGERRQTLRGRTAISRETEEAWRVEGKRAVLQTRLPGLFWEGGAVEGTVHDTEPCPRAPQRPRGQGSGGEQGWTRGAAGLRPRHLPQGHREHRCSLLEPPGQQGRIPVLLLLPHNQPGRLLSNSGEGARPARGRRLAAQLTSGPLAKGPLLTAAGR